MATLTQNFLGLADVYKRTNPDGSAADIIEMLNDTSQDVLGDWQYMECNDGTKHVRTSRSGLGSVAWGALYEGIPQSKSQVQQVTDTTGFVEKLCTVDKRVLDLAGDNRLAVRVQESEADIEAMAQELVSAFFYHNPATNARHPKGLGARYGTIATSGAGNQIIDAGGTGSDNTSIWMVTWGNRGVSAIYPKGTQAGIKQEDKGEQRVLDSAGNAYYVEEEMIASHCGFSVGDYRLVSCVRNVDVSNMQAGSVDLYKFLRNAYYKHHSRRAPKIANDRENQGGYTVIYCNRDVLEALDAIGTNSGASDNFIRMSGMEIQGREVPTYRGIPIRETDAILNTESQIT